MFIYVKYHFMSKSICIYDNIDELKYSIFLPRYKYFPVDYLNRSSTVQDAAVYL